MNKLNNKKIPVIAAVCAAVAAAGLVVYTALRPEETETDGQARALLASQSDISEKHIYKKYSDQFIADADIVAPYQEQVDVLLAKKYHYKQDKVISLLFGGNQPKIKEVQPGCASFEGQDAAGSYAFLDEDEFGYGLLNFGTNHSRDVMLPFDNFSTNEEFVNFVPRYFEVYKKDSLDFMPPDEAIRHVRDVLEQFGITVSDDVEIHALDCETMQEYQDYYREHDPDSAINYPIKETLTKDDEFYYLCFTAVANDMPVTRYAYFSSVGRDLVGCNIKVCYSKDGIFDFATEGLYTVQGVDRTIAHTLTAEQALDKAYEAFTAVYSTAEITVEELRFEYAPSAYNTNYSEVKYIPVWSMVVYQQDNDPEQAEKEAIKAAQRKEDDSIIGDENYRSTYAMNRYVWVIDAETGELLVKNG